MADKLLNGAGFSAADPILKGLGFTLLISPESMDVADVNSVNIETTSGFPPSGGSILASLSPAETVIEKGTAGSYDDTLDQLTIGSTTGLTAGDYIYLSHASITDAFYQIASIVDGTKTTIINDPFAGGGNQSSISFQVGWKYDGTTGTAPSTSSAPGQVNYYKSDLDDGATSTETEDQNYIRDALSGASYISIGGQSYIGGVISTTNPALAILATWAAQGGISHVALSGADAFWNVGLTDQTEKTLVSAEGSGLHITSSQGPKTFNILLRSKTGGIDLTVACTPTLDTAGPNITQSVIGR